MDDLRRTAYEIVFRACGFASLAIFCFMVGLSFEPRIAFKAGGALTMVMTLVLYVKALRAPHKPYRRTEIWLYLSDEQRPPAASAQQITSQIMRETYLVFSFWTSGVAVCMWFLALVFSVLGF